MKTFLYILISFLVIACGEKQVTHTVIQKVHKVDLYIEGDSATAQIQLSRGQASFEVDLPYHLELEVLSGELVEVFANNGRTSSAGDISIKVYIDGFFDKGVIAGGADTAYLEGYLLDERVEPIFIVDYTLLGIYELPLPTLLPGNDLVLQMQYMTAKEEEILKSFLFER